MKFLLVFCLLCSTLLADTIKIGIMLPLSGNHDFIGKPQLDALNLFKQELTHRSTRHTYQFIVEDDQMTARLAAQAGQKLIHVDKVAALLSFSSASGNVIAALAQQNKILHLSLSSDDKVAKGSYNFTHWLRPHNQAPLMAQYLQAKGVTSVGIISMQQQGIIATAEEFKKVLPLYGIKIAYIEYFNPGERDFRPLLLKLPTPPPQAIIPLALAPESDILLRQMKTWGSPALITSIQAFDTVVDKSLIEGVVYISAAQSNNDFKEKFAAFKKGEMDWINPYVYNCLAMMVDALETCPTPSTDRAPAVQYLENLTGYRSAVGTISVEPEGIFSAPISLYKVINGKKTFISLQDATVK